MSIAARSPRTRSTATSKPGPSPTDARDGRRGKSINAFRAVRAHTEKLAAPLSPEDQVVQSMPDASPTKWHRAHTTWFFEQFLLHPLAPDYRAFDSRFSFLFNSYYVAAGPRHDRPKRGLITRPGTAEVAAYRSHVDAAVERLIAECPMDQLDEVLRIVEIGLHHEQQHQELLLTDILHALAENPCAPAYDASWQAPALAETDGFVELDEGIHSIGHQGKGFSYDNEGPPHRALVGPVRVARALVTNGEWLAFMRDGGYDNPALWLYDGWAVVNTEQWRAPGYWRNVDGAWFAMTLGGLRAIDESAPVCHISYYEADAFARWSGRHLPSEEEWEVAAATGELADTFDFVWQWTRSAYTPYPGFCAAGGALGEYNGKFMANQMVLRGSSHATPHGHTRLTYRNFFYPPSRWQFTGLRLAEFPG